MYYILAFFLPHIHNYILVCFLTRLAAVQGGAMTLHMGLRSAEQLGGLGVMSGYALIPYREEYVASNLYLTLYSLSKFAIISLFVINTTICPMVALH